MKARVVNVYMNREVLNWIDVNVRTENFRSRSEAANFCCRKMMELVSKRSNPDILHALLSTHLPLELSKGMLGSFLADRITGNSQA